MTLEKNRSAKTLNAKEFDERENILVTAITNFLKNRVGEPWTGTATELLDLLEQSDDRIKKERGWSQSPKSLARKLRLSAPALLAVGIAVAFSRTKSRRTIRLRKVAADTVIDESLHRHQSESGDDTNAPTVTDEINNTASADSSAISDAIEKDFSSLFEKNCEGPEPTSFLSDGKPDGNSMKISG